MIHMSQVKVSIEEILKASPPELTRHGIISDAEAELVKKAAAGQLKISENQIDKIQIDRKSLDARKKHQISYIYQVQVKLLAGEKAEQKIIKKYGKNDVKYITEKSGKACLSSNRKIDVNLYDEAGKKCRIVIAGMGPAGLSAAYELAKAGKAPIIIERGLEVSRRQKKVESFWEGGKLDTECNVQFGEGGAGTFSDGKLNTLVKDKSGYNRLVLENFVEFGAPSEILYLQKPHIGTDRLKGVVTSMRQEIIRLGGQVMFDTRLKDVIIKDGCLKQIKLHHNSSDKDEIIDCDKLILATGHSSRDTFEMLKDRGIHMQRKPFAVGVRVEHPQEMIGLNQYGDLYKRLPAADYKLTYTTQSGRGVYSFCMCPGGYVVNASSEEGRLVVNGMSDYSRDSKNANSAIVVTVSPEDFGGEDVLAGVEFQRRLESAAYNAVAEKHGLIPVQLLADFKQNRVSTGYGAYTPVTRGVCGFGNVRAALPEFVGDAIAEGMTHFDHRIKGYGRDDAIILGVESRTSSPLKIIRDETMQSNIRGIYPCGEGAGYAGGITSAAMDGIRVARNILA